MSDILKLAASIDGMTAALNRLADLQGDAPAAPKAADKPAKKPAAPPADDDDETIDYETQIKPLIPTLSKSHGRDAVMAILNSFENTADGEPATKGSQIAPSEHAALLAKLEKLGKKKPPAPADDDDD